jgi:hypothetical protein
MASILKIAKPLRHIQLRVRQFVLRGSAKRTSHDSEAVPYNAASKSRQFLGIRHWLAFGKP